MNKEVIWDTIMILIIAILFTSGSYYFLESRRLEYNLELYKEGYENYKSDFYNCRDKFYQLKNKGGFLREILEFEVNKTNLTGNCYSYAKYYNKTLTEKYPQLDIEWIRPFDICNNFTYCDSYHTFLIVGGYGAECICDQSLIACVDIKRLKNETNLSLL